MDGRIDVMDERIDMADKSDMADKMGHLEGLMHG